MDLTEAQVAALLRFPKSGSDVSFPLDPTVNDVHALIEAGLAEGAIEFSADPNSPRAKNNGWMGRLTPAGREARKVAVARGIFGGQFPLALKVLGDANGGGQTARAWFHVPCPILDNRRPLDVLDDEGGADRVAAALETIFAEGHA